MTHEADRGAGAGQGWQQRGRVPLPPEDLRAVLAPVDPVRASLDRVDRRLVEAAARSELGRVIGFAGCTDAPQALADRLARRLADQIQRDAAGRGLTPLSCAGLMIQG
ncbi:hypothetical protein OG568_08775 [Streptomyces sp. NBC_01450]|uniref:hypothetical protein n=1 Tax=Streptomyces sp. NBC_01450 TaxID=2903871 RepID=UPI002E2FAA84|nr:hypothetical protein [Streptomyces sp. NBC_01450]